ncbi:helix-turn-helix domain-containing protein [Butyrivibrio sp. XPD2002]|uniref:helix-turn-helix domain-containing protein n=1 Tax=Butyrivibrio sp. XPD2002 TaxID=1280665 RepID=UPI00047D4D8A|nr:helix-turn-helix transcriptional regulator [Butyrivibrio sp. XPD2002]
MITFDPFWETIKEKNISQYRLIKEYGFSTGTLDALRKNESVTLKTINDICNKIDCDIPDVIRYIPDI